MAIRLAGFGPGVVFALFGAWLIFFAITRDIVTEYDRVTDPYGVIQENGRAEAASSPVRP